MIYQPDFEEECRICGTSPCVIVVGHVKPDTELCGVCFFHDRDMVFWEIWNDQEPTNEEEES